MKTPTLEEVKEYFKNVKTIEGLYYKKDYPINTEKYGIILDDGEYRQDKDENNHQLLLWDKTLGYSKIISYKDEPIGNTEQLQTPNHYDNSKGTLYKVATESNWNPYLFDIVKRLERSEKKGEFKTDLEKSINVIKLWLQEYEVNN